jgi:hypothetical protein
MFRLRRLPAQWGATGTYAFFVAAILYRFGLTCRYSPYVEFKVDEFLWLMAAYRNLHDHLALIGSPSSVGLPQPPFFIYLLSIPVFWTTDPILVSLFIVLVNAGGLVVLYLALRRLFSRDIAIAATALLCTAPWAIIFSRKVWPSDVIVPLMAIFLFFFSAYLRDGRRWTLYAAFAAFDLLLQPNQSAWFLCLPFAVFLALDRLRLAWKDLVAALLIFGLLFGRYIYHFSVVDTSTLPALIRSHFGHLGAQHTPEWFRLQWSVFITTGLHFEFLLGRGGYQRFVEAFPVVTAFLPVFQLYVVLSSAALVYYVWDTARQVWSTWRGRQTMTSQVKVIALLLTFFVGLHVSYMILDMPVWPHYFLVTYPTLALLTVLLADRIRVGRPAWRVWTQAVLGAIVVANMGFMTCFFLFVAHHPGEINGDYGTPYVFKRADWGAQIRHEVQGILAASHNQK